jgi:hypothetical protein
LNAEGDVTRLILVTAAALLLFGAALGADGQGKSKKQKDGKHAAAADTGKVSAVAISVSWGTRDLEIVRRHYAPRYRNLPPGLQKKYARTGQLPPGWQKKMEPFPASLEHQCAALPDGYRRGVIDAHAVIYNARGTIVDVAVLF